MDLFLPMLGIGLVTSVHCVAMCGSMVMTYAVKDTTGGPLLRRMVPHFAYQSSKLLSYVMVGLILGTIGSALNLGGIRGYVTVFAGVFMILLGLNMTGKFPWLRHLTFRPPKFLTQALMKTRKKANADASEGRFSLATPLTFGLLTGLMPCGPLQSAQLAAAGAGSTFAGAMTMLGFGLGTMPLMLGFGAVSGILGQKFKARMLVVAAGVVMILGLVMLNRGAALVGSPVTFNTVKTAVLGGPQGSATPVSYKTGADGVVEIPLVIENTEFVPQVVSIPADKPVRLVVDRREDNACSAQLAVPQLGVLADLKPNATTVVGLPASKAGAYTLTCGMGMMSGRVDVGGGAPGSGTNPLPIVAFLLAGGIAAAYVFYRRHQALAVQQRGARGGSRGTHPHARPAPATGLFGFTREEVLVVGAALVIAIVVGLYAGGAF